MQPFDALSLKAVLQEAKPLLLNKRVDKISQLGRDEILIGLRAKSGNINIFLSAHSTYARICLVQIPSSGDKANSNDKNIFERYQIKEKFKSQPKFGVILRKLLYAATLVGVEQLPGERVIDFVFSCVDEVGTTSLKVLSAELMGRHSNLIFWDKETRLILAASHVVTKEMSRRREILPKGIYERPPAPDKPNIFLLDKSVLEEKIKALSSSVDGHNPSENLTPPYSVTYEQWLLSTFSGLGKTLAEELVQSFNLSSRIEKFDSEELTETIWQKISALQNIANFSPHMCKNYSTYTSLGWSKHDDWIEFSTCNDMIEQYYRVLESKEQFSQLKERLFSEVRSERQKLEIRRAQAGEHAVNEEELSNLKTTGDLILAHLSSVKPGQEELLIDETKIKINPLLSGVQNAQHYYRLYAKARARISSASSVLDEINSRLSFLDKIESAIKEAPGLSELYAVKDTLMPKNPAAKQTANARKTNSHNKREQDANNKNSGKRRLLNLASTDGWKIYAGRNRHENSHLLSIANQYDIWLHVLGQSGAHVLIRVPSTKQDPPKTTLLEAAQIAARLSRVPAGAKVTVVYTQCRYVKSLDKNKIGQVRYENERTLLVDTAVAMPDLIKRLYS